MLSPCRTLVSAAGSVFQVMSPASCGAVRRGVAGREAGRRRGALTDHSRLLAANGVVHLLKLPCALPPPPRTTPRRRADAPTIKTARRRPLTHTRAGTHTQTHTRARWRSAGGPFVPFFPASFLFLPQTCARASLIAARFVNDSSPRLPPQDDYKMAEINRSALSDYAYTMCVFLIFSCFHIFLFIVCPRVISIPLIFVLKFANLQAINTIGLCFCQEQCH